jgi:SAM-dependent methyltransferase
MNVFGNYAHYYNLLYRDKDYAGEAKFIHQLLQTYAPSTQSILELGCGTGTHAQLLAKEGYEVHGVDLSTQMLEQASDRFSQLPQELASRLLFLMEIFGQSDSTDSLMRSSHFSTYSATRRPMKTCRRPLLLQKPILSLEESLFSTAGMGRLC